MSHLFRTVISVLLLAAAANAQREIPPGSLNKPERLEWFRDLGFGMFIHWSVDSQTGVVISHSLVGADEAYTNRFFTICRRLSIRASSIRRIGPRWRNSPGSGTSSSPTKHHSGFAMWDTKTTDFGIMHTPFKRDITREILDAFRAQGIRAGIYFSPDDFCWLWTEQDRHSARYPGRAAAQQSRPDETRSGPGARADDELRPDRRRLLRWRAAGSARPRVEAAAGHDRHARRHSNSRTVRARDPAGRRLGGQLHHGHRLAVPAAERKLQDRRPGDRHPGGDARQGRQSAVQHRARSPTANCPSSRRNACARSRYGCRSTRSASTACAPG